MARLTDPTPQTRSAATTRTSYVPLLITARLQQGVVLDTLYGTALDGLLASVIRDRGKAAAALPGSLYDGGLAATQPAVVDLPLARCLLAAQHDDESDGQDPHAGEWHWAATTAHPGTSALGDSYATGVPGAPQDPDVHHIHTRINERVVEAAATRVPASLPPASGRFRNRRLPVVTTPTTHLTWRAVGDPAAIADLLDDLTSIGGHRHRGEGTVLGWDLTVESTGDPDDYGHLHHDSTLGRPVPTPCLEALRRRHPHLTTTQTAAVGIRPPYWHPTTRRIQHLPMPLADLNHAAREG